MYQVPKKLIYSMSATHKPVLSVPNGSTLVFETCDCFEDQITSEQTPFQALDWARINPATGPVFIEGADPGDMLEVKIEKIKLRDHGVMVTGPDMGVLGDELTENSIRIIPIRQGKVFFTENVELPLNSMIGVIGTAPLNEDISCGTPGNHGGNMDCKIIGEGATLYLPVNVPGGLLALGDLHAAMGDGEVSVCGVEVSGEVTLSVMVIKGKQWLLPFVKTSKAIYMIASEKSLDEAAIRATKNMVHFLVSECALSQYDAITLLSIAGNLQICQIVDPLKTVRMELPLSVLDQLEYTF
ncbi:MAG TPA: acetamidase/formamidase family protein [Desulfosporosinus sp.]|nr:acetamidase/formamidase family protein [Desulfosporosinus sp.]